MIMLLVNIASRKEKKKNLVGPKNGRGVQTPLICPSPNTKNIKKENAIFNLTGGTQKKSHFQKKKEIGWGVTSHSLHGGGRLQKQIPLFLKRTIFTLDIRGPQWLTPKMKIKTCLSAP